MSIVNHTRRFSIEDDFMHYSTDDLLYGAMQYLATYHPKEKRLYLTVKAFEKHRKEFYALCNLNAGKLRRRLDALKEKGLLKEELIDCGGDEPLLSYTFPYNYDTNYQIIDSEMLWYIVSTRNAQAVRIYIHLYNWYLYKTKEHDTYVFTNKDLLRAIGYSTDNKLASSMITNILESFSREGVIKYQEFREECITPKGEVTQTPKKRLLFVAGTKSELK